MSSIKGIIFDYGGTIDTNGIHWGEFIWEEYQKAGVDIPHNTYRDAYVYGERHLAKNYIIEPTDTFHALLKKKIAIQFEYLRNNYKSDGFSEMTVSLIADSCYNKVKKTLSSTCAIVAKLSTKYPLVLVTNFYGNMSVVLKEFGLEKYFKAIVESSVVGLRKPDPALFALGVKALGLQPNEIIVIGDSYSKDIYPANSLGCKTIWIKNICWKEETVIEGYEPAYTINGLEELPYIIELP